MFSLRGALSLTSLGVTRSAHVARAAASDALRRRYSSACGGKMKVTICGAAGSTGQPLSLLLKQSPLIDELALYDVFSTCGVGMELGHVDTKCGVTSFSGIGMLCDSLKNARVVVIVAGSGTDTFDKNAPIVSLLAAHICDACPTAMTVVATEPVESMVPLVAEIQRCRGTYDPRRVLGVTEHNNMRANIVVADFLRITPERVNVQVIGGASSNTMVPVLSTAIYPDSFDQEQVECVTAAILGCEGMQSCAMKCSEGACLSGAYAIARVVINVVKGLTGKSNVTQIAYVDTECKHAPGCQFLVNEVVLGTAGVERTLGIPELSPFENCLMINSIPLIRKEIARAEWTVSAMSEDPCKYAHLFPAACSSQPCCCCMTPCCCGQDPCCCRPACTCKKNMPGCCINPCVCCGQDPCCCCSSPCHICCKDPCKCPARTCKCCAKVPCECEQSCMVCKKKPCCCGQNICFCSSGKSSCGGNSCNSGGCKFCGKDPCCCPQCPKMESGKNQSVCPYPSGCGPKPCCSNDPGCRRAQVFCCSAQPVAMCRGWDWTKKPSKENYENPRKPCECCYLAPRWTPKEGAAKGDSCSKNIDNQLKVSGNQCGCSKLPASLRILKQTDCP